MVNNGERGPKPPPTPEVRSSLKGPSDPGNQQPPWSKEKRSQAVNHRKVMLQPKGQQRKASRRAPTAKGDREPGTTGQGPAMSLTRSSTGKLPYILIFHFTTTILIHFPEPSYTANSAQITDLPSALVALTDCIDSVVKVVPTSIMHNSLKC